MKQLLITIAAVVLVGCGGRTATAPDISIHEAAEDGNIEAIKQHIAAGTDVNAKYDDGETPLDWAIKKEYPETADLLRKNGGKIAEELKAKGK